MEYANHLSDYAATPTAEQVAEITTAMKSAAVANQNNEVYKFCLSAIDLTTLSCCDTAESVSAMARRAAEFGVDYPHLQNVASICVYPPFVENVGLEIDGTPLRITSVAAGFPASQTFLEVKMLEVAMAIENGADEVDVVLNVGKILSNEYDEAANEIEVLRAESEDATLKVILETGALATPENIYNASLLAMAAGADFIKTSTGKESPAATPEAAYVMCSTIKEYYAKTGRKIGFKPAGGINTVHDALVYYTIVKELLGEEWMTNKLFRLGTSRLANLCLSEIVGKEVKFF